MAIGKHTSRTAGSLLIAPHVLCVAAAGRKLSLSISSLFATNRSNILSEQEDK